MSLYAIAVFLHVVGALALFAALGLEWAGVLNLRRATAVGQAREWARLLAAIRRVAAPALLGATLSGRWSGALIRALPAADTSIPDAFAARLRDPVLMVSLWLRTALALGIVFVMSTKPSGAGAVTAMGVALVLGSWAGLPAWVRGRRPFPARTWGPLT